MKHINIIIRFFFVTLLVGCSNKKPQTADFIGIWKGEDSSIIEFRSDGTFIATNFPAELFNIPPDDYKGIHFNGQGGWSISSARNSWDQIPFQIDLNFNEISDKKLLTNIRLLVSGGGFLENTQPWKYIFCWEGEEGGGRYEFVRQE